MKKNISNSNTLQRNMTMKTNVRKVSTPQYMHLVGPTTTSNKRNKVGRGAGIEDSILNTRGRSQKPISLQKQKELIAKIKDHEKQKQNIYENEFDMTCEADLVFLRDFLVPYLSNVFRSLLARSKTEYLPLWRVKEYLGL